ncbi:hypothetical protein NUU61_007036 [Penicillium alfredii]|uniref:Uncharacterized protein n=1 Tax=Penicillium alfredii TaxID=1506179 RepID=A0A9W9F253_9EURO|nr:uncharacterized protein NUU61_007036 [Penicillium alfredii]KAJ5092166.1 hypothetical protein NUU61_007036 [Penicillium alfredii]
MKALLQCIVDPWGIAWRCCGSPRQSPNPVLLRDFNREKTIESIMAEKSKNPFEHMGDDQASTSAEAPVTNTRDPAAGDSAPPPYTPVSETLGQASSSSIPVQASQSQRDRPIAIPAINSSFDSPFIRAYAPILTDYQLPRESFLRFLDQLNKDVASSPPLQVLDATGGIINSVPLLFPLRWLGSAVSGLANLGSQGVSKSRTDSSIRQANRDIFGPRGLKVEIAKLDALAHVANIPILDSQGKVNRQAPLLQQLLAENPAPTLGGSPELDAQQQRIAILQPWIAELEFNVLPWTSKSKLTRFNTALKKRNDPEGEQTRANDEDSGFRKCLWLIIRDVEGRGKAK